MFLTLFILIAWIFIIIFFSIEKSLSKIKNIIIFFCLNIITINLFTVLTLNMKLIQNSSIPELNFCIVLQRNLIIPLSLLIYVNLAITETKFKKNITAICTLSALFSIELLLKWLDIKIYTGWSILATAITVIMMITISNLLANLLKRMPWECV